MIKFVYDLLAIVGILSLVVACIALVFFYVVSDENSYEIEKQVVSPENGYVASLYVSMGGGAAGWCSQAIAINSSEEKFDLDVEKTNGNFKVFTASCGSREAWR